MRRPQPLHEPARHETQRDGTWDDAAVRERVRRIAGRLQTEERAGPHAPHPATHPRDEDGPGPVDGCKGS